MLISVVTFANNPEREASILYLAVKKRGIELLFRHETTPPIQPQVQSKGEDMKPGAVN